MSPPLLHPSHPHSSPPTLTLHVRAHLCFSCRACSVPSSPPPSLLIPNSHPTHQSLPVLLLQSVHRPLPTLTPHPHSSPPTLTLHIRAHLCFSCRACSVPSPPPPPHPHSSPPNSHPTPQSLPVLLLQCAASPPHLHPPHPHSSPPNSHPTHQSLTVLLLQSVHRPLPTLPSSTSPNSHWLKTYPTVYSNCCSIPRKIFGKAPEPNLEVK